MPASAWSAPDGSVEEIATTPPLREAAELQTKLWLGDGYEAQLDAAEREGDPGALACLRGNRAKVFPFDAAAFSKALTRRATLDARMAAVPRDLCGAADAGLRRIAVPRRPRPARRRLLCAGVARAAAADRYSLHGAAWANGFHRAWSDGFRSAFRWSPAAIARICACSRARRSKPAERRRRRSIPSAEA